MVFIFFFYTSAKKYLFFIFKKKKKSLKILLEKCLQYIEKDKKTAARCLSELNATITTS